MGLLDILKGKKVKIQLQPPKPETSSAMPAPPPAIDDPFADFNVYTEIPMPPSTESPFHNDDDLLAVPPVPIMPLPNEPTQENVPILTGIPMPEPTPQAEPEPRPPADDLPDFTPEELALAKKLTESVKTAVDVPELPQLDEPDEPLADPFVDANAYNAAVQSVKAAKASLRKGDLALGRVSASMTAHKQSFTAFAESLNKVQESLIQLDNIMIQR